MRFLLILVPLLFLGTACNKTSSSISPLAGLGCSVESAVAGAEAATISSLLSCSGAAQIESDLMTALGNANLCNSPLPAPSGLVAQSVSSQWKKVGDVKDEDLKSGKGQKALDFHITGIVGSIACPIVVNVVIGYATQAIPTKWSCSAGSSAQSLSAALIAACTAAVPI